MSLSRVPGDDELYIGGIFTLRRRQTLEETGITHIVSVLRYDFKDFQDWEKYDGKQLGIDVDDVEDENLLEHMPRAVKFIREAIDGRGKVLVHCAMGKSRSVTIGIAYLLSKYAHHTVDSALSLIQEARSIAEPNPGFMAQLQLFKEMGCPENIEEEPKYQRWLYQREVEMSLATGRAPDKIRFEDEERQDGRKDGTDEDVEYRCKKCRRTLVTTPYIVSHTPKNPLPVTGPISSLESVTNPSTPACGHIFVDPLSWMRPELEQGKLEGRLICPNVKCGNNVGKYAWQGMKCTCAEWICPAVCLARSRMDEVFKKRVEQGTGIRLPPGSKGGGEKGNL